MYFGDHSFDPYDPYRYEDIRDYFDLESNFMVADGYSLTIKNQRMRQAALHVIVQIMGSTEVDVFVPYLAMNFFDRYSSNKRFIARNGTIMEEIEFLVVCCILIAYKTTLSLNVWSLDVDAEAKKMKLERDIRQFLAKRTNNIIYLKEWDIFGAETAIENELGIGLRINPITPMCFIGYFLDELKEKCELPRAKECITRLILELQDDISLCQFKPSIISASMVTTFASNHYPEHAETYVEKMTSIKCIQDKGQFNDCLDIVKHLCVKKNLVKDFVSKEYKLNWEISTDVEEFIRTLDSVTRQSVKLAAIDTKMHQQAQEIRNFAEGINAVENQGIGDEEVAELESMVQVWENQFQAMKEMTVKLIRSKESQE